MTCMQLLELTALFCLALECTVCVLLTASVHLKNHDFDAADKLKTLCFIWQLVSEAGH